MKFLRMKEITQMVALSVTQIKRLEKAGQFPQRVILGPNSIAWPEDEVNAWCSTRLKERNARIEHGANVA